MWNKTQQRQQKHDWVSFSMFFFFSCCILGCVWRALCVCMLWATYTRRWNTAISMKVCILRAFKITVLFAPVTYILLECVVRRYGLCGFGADFFFFVIALLLLCAALWHWFDIYGVFTYKQCCLFYKFLRFRNKILGFFFKYLKDFNNSENL